MKLYCGANDLVYKNRFLAARNHFFELLTQKYMYWHQRAKEFWLGEGDQNTRYFHAMATIRQKKNRIERLKDNSGHWQNWDSNLASVISKYFTDLFRSQRNRALILSIPLSSSRPPDWICWKLESKGIFTVRSAYKSFVWDSRLRGMIKSGMVSSLQRIRRWSKPSRDWLKINVDAITTIPDFCFGVGFVARDWNGSFLAAKNVVLQGNLMAKEVEAVGIKDALSWVLSKGWSANGVAHRLARATHSVSDVGEWIDHPPDFIVQALSEDFY
ncbi:hypothetical protein GH714_027317 [Hevea brasiliensis]|uniref:RNase H type-1 domain-containing protein n=1 Tax=Hevea brasiliensis TaxID=3981 RepID=A0A6A6K7W2_HEVBR|nr:hypothetical protein GH714_027317 [Hevea brasiliensis]